MFHSIHCRLLCSGGVLSARGLEGGCVGGRGFPKESVHEYRYRASSRAARRELIYRTDGPFVAINLSASSMDCLTTYDAVGEAFDIGRCSSGTRTSNLRGTVRQSVGRNLSCRIRSRLSKERVLTAVVQAVGKRHEVVQAAGYKLATPGRAGSSGTGNVAPLRQASDQHVSAR